jgi:colanic acid/amylovoran biosynthesis glycosyltransferase
MKSSSSSVIIYRNYLLSSSETFVRDQAESLTKFSPCYVGLRLVNGLPLSASKSLIVNRGGTISRLREIRTKLLGFSPLFVQQINVIEPILIHAHFGQDGAMTLPLAKLLNIPLIVTFHGADITVSDEAAQKSLMQKIYLQRRNELKKEAHTFIAVSNFIKQQLILKGFPPDRIVVHSIGINTDYFQFDPLHPREPVVLFVGRLVEKKGCRYLIEAMAKVQSIMPHVKLVVIGDGQLRTPLEQLAHKLLTNCSFLGVLSPSQVREWMQRAMVFCVPSITAKSGDAEGFGMVFAEAQAMGLPVVSSRHGGIPEAVAHEQTGFLVPEHDAESLSRDLLQLLQNQNLWNSFSRNGSERIRKHFNLHKQTRILEDLYDQAIEAHASSNSGYQCLRA